MAVLAKSSGKNWHTGMAKQQKKSNTVKQIIVAIQEFAI
jgi:hypothetical protein